MITKSYIQFNVTFYTTRTPAFWTLYSTTGIATRASLKNPKLTFKIIIWFFLYSVTPVPLQVIHLGPWLCSVSLWNVWYPPLPWWSLLWCPWCPWCPWFPWFPWCPSLSLLWFPELFGKWPDPLQVKQVF